MKMKKWIALAMCLVLMISLAACKNKEEKQPDDYISELPPIETAPQKDYTAEEIRDMYNGAVKKLAEAESYHMSGSTNSTTVYGGVLSSVVNSYNVKYSNVGGNLSVLYDSKLNSDGTDHSHIAYYDGEHYYYSITNPVWKYYKSTNDYQDFHAMDYLKTIETTEFSELRAMDQLDGSVEISFTVPMGKYMSDAIITLVGFMSETYEEDPVHVSFTLDAQGTMTYFYLSYTSTHYFFDQETEQTVIISMALDGYNETVVEKPTDLSTYENAVEETAGEEFEGVGILSPDDVD